MPTSFSSSWGIVKGSVVKLQQNYKVGNFPGMNTNVLVMRSARDVFVVFRATDDDWIADFNCMYTGDLRTNFSAPISSKKIQLHKGFWTAYSVIDEALVKEVNKAVAALKGFNPFAKPSVWFVGHSLAGALGSIAALRLSEHPSFGGEIGGVVSYGSPRVGNQAWQTLYNSRLLSVTVRFSNFRDMFAALPAQGQFCMSNSLKTVFDYRHVGRTVLMCPTADGMEEFRVFPKGTESYCALAEFPSIATHLLGHYFDGWRRAYATKFGVPAGLLLSHGNHVRSVMCAECATAVKPYPLPDNKAARNDGVVSCVNTQSCADKEKFGLVSWSGLTMTSLYRPDAVCDATTMLCHVPIPLKEITEAVASIAPAITTLAAVVQAPLARIFAGNSTVATAATNSLAEGHMESAAQAQNRTARRRAASVARAKAREAKNAA
eukprot:gene6149-6386_t